MSEELRAYSMASLVTDEPTDIHSNEYKEYEKRFPIYGGEAMYIYSFEEQKMLFTKGWEELLGYPDDEVTMLQLGNISDPEQLKFTVALNEASMKFCSVKRNDIDQCSYTYRINKIHKNGHRVPLFWRVSIFEAKDGFATKIMGHVQLLSGEPFGKVVIFETYGPGIHDFDEILQTELFEAPSISKKEMEVLQLVCEGLAYKEIADRLGVSQSAIEKRVRPMFKRFGVTGLPQLISFAHQNRLIL